MGIALEGIDFNQIRTEYQSGITITELSKKYDIKPVTLYKRRERDGWDSYKKQVQEIVQRSVEKSMEEVIPKIDEAKIWVQDTIERGKRYRKIIDNSVAQLSPTGKHDDALIDVDAIDGYTKSEQRIDDFTRRSLGLIDKPETTVNVTNSISLENYQQNLALIDKLSASGKLNSISLDIEALEEAGLELSQKQGFTLPRSTDQAMQDLYTASALAKQQELDKVMMPAKPVDPEEAGSL